MTQRLVPLLMILTGALAVAEFIDSVIIWREDYPDAQPWFAVVFGVLYLVALALQRRAHTVAGLRGRLVLGGGPGTTVVAELPVAGRTARTAVPVP